MHSIQISKEYVTPICFFLKKLEVWYPTEDEKYCDVSEGKRFTARAHSSAAFVLRHLSNLEEIVSVDDFCFAWIITFLPNLHNLPLPFT